MSRLGDSDLPRLPPAAWAGTTVLLPSHIGNLKNILTGESLSDMSGRLDLGTALSTLPVGLFTGLIS